MILFGMDLGPHWAFIVAAYGFALAGVLGLIVWVVIDRRLQNAALRDLESRGIRRRSQQQSPPAS